MSHYAGRTDCTIDDWETPNTVFQALDAEFRFQLDACATPRSAKCERFYTPEDDGLAQPWAPLRTWVNPPYGTALPRWVSKALAEAERATVVLLVPARTEVKWWRAAVNSERCKEARLIYPRVQFLHGGRPLQGNNHASTIIVLAPGQHERKIHSWTWREETRQVDLLDALKGPPEKRWNRSQS